MYTNDLKGYLISKNIPACDVIAYQNHKEIFRFFHGRTDEKGKKMVGDELYYLYSATKVITCTAALQLYEKGQLGIDDPVKKYLPEFSSLSYKKDKKIYPCTNVLTIRHLFTMTGGFNYDRKTDPIKAVLRETNNKATTQQVVNAFAKSPLEFEPGTRYNYSLCHDILGAVIEVVSGKTLGEYFKENIFAPLGMRNTAFFPDKEQQKKLITQYTYGDDGNFIKVSNKCGYKISKNYESGGAGLFSCVGDYILFSDALACGGVGKNGAQILKPETIELMRTNQLVGQLMEDFRAKAANKPGYGYAFGVYTMLDPKEAFNSNAPIGVFGWDGAAGAYTAIDPENKISIFYAQQVLGHGWVYTEVHPTIRDTIYKMVAQ